MNLPIVHWPQQPYFLKKHPDRDGLIITGTKMTNTGHFLWNGSSKIKFFTNILYLFWQRLLRLAYVIFLKTGWWNSNAKTSEIHRYLHFDQKIVFSWPQRSRSNSGSGPRFMVVDPGVHYRVHYLLQFWRSRRYRKLEELATGFRNRPQVHY
jgi:hypothetical protein